jgi:hypothetical protein
VIISMLFGSALAAGAAVTVSHVVGTAQPAAANQQQQRQQQQQQQQQPYNYGTP